MTKINTQIQRSKTILQRFEEKFDRVDGCWEWKSALTKKGYGAFWISNERRCEGAHRYALELKLGMILPDNMSVMHSCDNPKCVNPDHLSLGTTSDNLRDASRKGRIAHGSRNKGGNKLTERDAQVIFNSRFISNGEQTARRFGVARQIVNSIRRGQLWQRATGMAHG